MDQRKAARHMSAQPGRMDGLPLSPREQEVLEQVARGMTNAEIGEWLGMKEGTVKVHVWACLLKLSLRNRVELTLWFHKLPVGSA